MSFFWFLFFSAHFAIATSLVQLGDNDLRHKLSGMHLSLYHVTSLDPSLTSNSKSPISYSDIFNKDQDRVRYIQSKLANKVDVKSSDRTLGPKLVSTPLKSGLSIGSGNYYVKIGFGTPPKFSSMIVDTGSSLSWLQCEPCAVSCHPQVDPIFDPSTSKSYKTLPCSSTQCSSLKASTLNDPGFVFGCGQDNQGLFGKAAGILGLANDKLSLIGQLSNKNGYGFSYCLPTSFSSPNSSKEGFLSIGTSSFPPSSSFKFTPLIKNPKIHSLYFVDLSVITVAGKPLGVAASSYKVPTIIDSGTVITRLPMSVYTALSNSFVKILSKKYPQVPGFSILDTCFKGSLKDLSSAVPEIQIVFQGGANLPLKAENTLLEIEDGTTCLAIAGSPEDNPIAIIGNFQQQTFTVAYDVANSKVGFAPAGCQ
ncbi:hypothetical protein AAHE18_14G060100 [Arachis hypogaea]|nr:aspartyl protease family protein At5g10770 isoform X2 [Arachis hypogaea]